MQGRPNDRLWVKVNCAMPLSFTTLGLQAPDPVDQIGIERVKSRSGREMLVLPCKYVMS